MLRWLLPLFVSGLVAWLVLRKIDYQVLVNNLKNITWQSYLLATILYFASYILRVFSWHFFLRCKISYKDAFLTMGAGYLLNNLFPFRLGEIGRAVLLDEPERISFFQVLSSVFVERLFDVLLAAVFILSVLPKIIGGYFDKRLILLTFVLALCGLVSLFVLVKKRQAVENWLYREKSEHKKLQSWLAPKIVRFLDGLSTLTTPKIFLLAFVSLTLSWGVAFMQNWVIFRDLYSTPPFWWMVFVLSAGAFGAALPSAPAGLGVFEGAVVASFGLLNVQPEMALTHAMIIHGMSVIFSSLIGLAGLHLRGEAIFGFFQRVVAHDPHRGTTA